MTSKDDPVATAVERACHDTAKAMIVERDTSQPKTYLVCYGTPSPRAVIVGESDTEPVVGKPITLRNVRMVLYWASGGLHGLIANGPSQGSRITAAAPQYSVTVAEWGELTESAADRLRGYPAC